MKASTLMVVLAVALAGAGFGASTGRAEDTATVIKQRQALMKEQGKDLGAVKGFLDDKGDQAHAQAGVDDLLKTIPTIPSHFPQKTSDAEYPGKTRAKPVIWAEWNKFNAAQQSALAKAKVLDAAVKSGDKGSIKVAFGDLGKNGCGGCHETFRAPPPKK